MNLRKKNNEDASDIAISHSEGNIKIQYLERFKYNLEMYNTLPQKDGKVVFKNLNAQGVIILPKS